MGVSPAFSASNEVETPRMPDELGAKAETEAVARALTVMMSFMACRSSKMTIEIMGLRKEERVCEGEHVCALQSPDQLTICFSRPTLPLSLSLPRLCEKVEDYHANSVLNCRSCYKSCIAK